MSQTPKYYSGEDSREYSPVCRATYEKAFSNRTSPAPGLSTHYFHLLFLPPVVVPRRRATEDLDLSLRHGPDFAGALASNRCAMTHHKPRIFTGGAQGLPAGDGRSRGGEGGGWEGGGVAQKHGGTPLAFGEWGGGR